MPMPDDATAESPLDKLRCLPRDGTLAIEQPLGQELWCVQGALWITHDGDPKDHLLAAGRGYVALRSGRLLAQALDDEVRVLVRAAC
jgi:hypothetical protein